MRYRYDEANRTRIKTMELIVEKKEMTTPHQRIADNAQVPVRIAYGEKRLGELAATEGGEMGF